MLTAIRTEIAVGSRNSPHLLVNVVWTSRVRCPPRREAMHASMRRPASEARSRKDCSTSARDLPRYQRLFLSTFKEISILFKGGKRRMNRFRSQESVKGCDEDEDHTTDDAELLRFCRPHRLSWNSTGMLSCLKILLIISKPKPWTRDIAPFVNLASFHKVHATCFLPFDCAHPRSSFPGASATVDLSVVPARWGILAVCSF